MTKAVPEKDMTRSAHNYFAHGGGELVIGGKLTFLPGATVEGGDSLFGQSEPAAQIAYIADSEATTIEVKTHLRIQYDDEDAYLESLIRQAQATAEDYCRVQFSEPAPEPVRLAVLLFVSHYYENRDNPDRAMYATMRIAFENLLYPYRDPVKMF